MNHSSRLLLSAAAFLLLLSLLQPLWTISLSAPQYPEGIGLKIWAHQITGQKEQDLRNINGLNHYIGMKAIEPDSIPELRILPPTILALSILGLLAAWSGRRGLLTAWLAVLLVAGIAGLVDFYLWEHDYGHNLNPDAAIKIPGMSFQPPLIGTKQLLNMRTTVLPGLGGVAIFLALGLGLAAWWRSRTPVPPRRATKAVAPLLSGAALLLGVTLSCQAGPRDIRYRSDACARCRMFVMDERYGAELVTRTGKVLTFDSAECLAAHVQEAPQDAAGAKALLVTHHARPRVLAPAATSLFLRSAQLPSPMGLGLTACRDSAEALALRKVHGGEILDWPRVLSHVRGAWKIQ